MPTRDVIAHPTTGLRDMTRFNPGWTNFFQKLQDAGDQAAARGKRFGVDLSGFGNGMSRRTRGQSTALSSLAGDDPSQAAVNDFNEDAAFAPMRRRAAELELANAFENRSSAALDALNTPDRDLFTGQAGARFRKQGDIVREENVRNATNAADVYHAPGMRDLRQQQLWDKEREQQTLYPFSKVASDAQRAIDVATINAGGRLGAAQATGDARRDSAALSALARTGSAVVLPGSEGRVDAAQNAIMPNVPGQSGAPNTGKVFPAARLEEFARSQRFTSAAQARQYLEQVAGYRVQ